MPNKQDLRQDIVRILIVEDEPWSAETLRDLLCDPDGSVFSCSLAETLAEGLSFLKKNPCDVVLLDLGLPDSWGLDTARAVRKEFSSLCPSSS